MRKHPDDEADDDAAYQSWIEHYSRELPLDFTVAVLEGLELPIVVTQYNGLPKRLENIPAEDVLFDTLESQEVLDALMEVVKACEGPGVMKLIDTMAKCYSDTYSEPLALWQMEQRK